MYQHYSSYYLESTPTWIAPSPRDHVTTPKCHNGCPLGGTAEVAFSKTHCSIPTDRRRLGSSGREHKLVKPSQPWLAALERIHVETSPGLLEVPHARTCLSTDTSYPHLGSTRHAPSLPSVWQPRLAAAGVLKICKIGIFMHACEHARKEFNRYPVPLSDSGFQPCFSALFSRLPQDFEDLIVQFRQREIGALVSANQRTKADMSVQGPAIGENERKTALWPRQIHREKTPEDRWLRRAARIAEPDKGSVTSYTEHIPPHGSECQGRREREREMPDGDRGGDEAYGCFRDILVKRAVVKQSRTSSAVLVRVCMCVWKA